VNRDGADVPRPGRARHQQTIPALPEIAMSVGIMHVLHDMCGIQQHYNVMGQETDSVDHELRFREQHRACLGHPEG
jgi:hypothetical protein